jgi:hypothetical protein
MISALRRGTVPFSLRENRDSPRAVSRPILARFRWRHPTATRWARLHWAEHSARPPTRTSSDPPNRALPRPAVCFRLAAGRLRPPGSSGTVVNHGAENRCTVRAIVGRVRQRLPDQELGQWPRARDEEPGRERAARSLSPYLSNPH